MSATLPDVSYEPTRLEIPDDLTFDAWIGLLDALDGIQRGHQWWVGDALVHGEEKYGDEATFQAVADHLHAEPHTLTNWRWVASAVAPSRRRDELTWSHHAEVARLKSGQQEKALKWAVDGEKGVRELRDHVALNWPTPRDEKEPRGDDGRDEIDENRRLEAIDLRWDGADEPDRYGHLRRVTQQDVLDVRWLLAVARKVIR